VTRPGSGKAKRKLNPGAVFANVNTLPARLDLPVNEEGCGELLLKKAYGGVQRVSTRTLGPVDV